MVGELLLSTATSPQGKLTAGLKSLGDITNSSPKQEKPEEGSRCNSPDEGALLARRNEECVVDSGKDLDSYRQS